MLWLALLAVGAAAVVIASDDDGAEPFSVVPITAHFIPPHETVTGAASKDYAQTNNAGNIAGLIPFNAKDVPRARIPTAGVIGKAVVGVATALIDLAGQWNSGKLYPSHWTEPDGEMLELGAMAFRGWADVDVTVDAFTINKGATHLCQRLTFKATGVEVSRVVLPQVQHIAQQTQTGRVGCLFLNRQYSDVIPQTVVPRPEAPGDFQLHIAIHGNVMRFYLWMPPRVGRYRVEARWSVRRPKA